jgi:hypothetical protein
MKFFMVFFLLFNLAAHADCDISALRKQMLQTYSGALPVSNERGDVGEAVISDMMVSESLLSVKSEQFLLGQFSLNVSWKNGEKQKVKTMVVGTVDISTCSLEAFSTDDVFGSSISAK